MPHVNKEEAHYEVITFSYFSGFIVSYEISISQPPQYYVARSICFILITRY